MEDDDAPEVMSADEFEEAGGRYHEPDYEPAPPDDDEASASARAPASAGAAPTVMSAEEFEKAGGKYHEPEYTPPEQSRKSDNAERGSLSTLVRGAAHGLIPGAAGAAGIGAGAAIGSVLGPIGTVGGALIGGLAAGAAASYGQEKVIENVAPEEAKAWKESQEQHPFLAPIGEAAGALPSFGLGAAKGAANLALRAGVGGVMGGVDLAMGNDPLHAAGVGVGAAAVMGNPTKLGSTLIKAGESAAERVGGRPGFSESLARGMAEKENAQGTPATPTQEAAAGEAASTEGTPDVVGERPPADGSRQPSGGPSNALGTAADVAKQTANEAPSGENLTPRPDGRGPTELGKDKVAPEGGYPVTDKPVDDAAVAALKPTETAAPAQVPQDLGTSLRAIRDREATTARAPDDRVTQEVGEGRPPSTLTKAGREAADINRATEEALPKGAPKEESTLTRNVEGRGRSGRPIKTEPLSIGTEEKILEKGAEKATGPKLPPEEAPPELQGATRKPVGGDGGPPQGPKEARLHLPPVHESAPNTLWNRAKSYFAPEFMSPASNVSGEALGRHRGRMQALDDKWTGELEKHYPAVEAEIKAGNGKQLMDVLEGQKNYPNYKVPDALKPLVEDVKRMNEEYKEAIARHAQDPDAVKNWNAQHLPHLYSDFEKAQGLLERTGGSGVRGSGGSLNERKYQSYFDAAKEGLEPKYTNPLDALKAYRTELGKFLGNRDAIQEMRDKGALKFANPEPRVGGSGQFGTQGGGRIHPDWEPVKNLTMGGRQGYMPRDAAHVFNNYLDPGWRGNPFYNIGRELNNRMTQIELGLFNGFHAFVVGNESMLSNMGRGISEMAKGDFSGGAKTIAKSPAAAYTNYAEGRRSLSAVTGQENRFSRARPLTEEDRALVRAAQDAGVMPSGRGMAPDVNMGGGENLWKSYMRDSFGREMHEMGQRIKDNPLKGVPIETWNMVGRTMQTMSEPLFGHYIPALKFGTLMEDARSFIKQSGIDIRTPQGQQEINQFMRKQRNAIDNRLGEMNRDMMFMNGMARDAGYLTMRSMSWFLGTAKALGGGYGGVMKDMVNSRGNPKELGRMLAEKLDMTHKNYDPNFAYAVAFPFGIAFMGAVYQFIHTGLTTGKPELPDTSSAGALFRDLTTPRTGGKIPGFAGKGQVDERVMLPGYHRDLFGWMHDPKQEAYNKQNVVLSTAEEELGGRDSFGRPFVRPNATLPENALDRMKYAGSKILPFAARNLFTEAPKKGTGLTTLERGLGFRSAGTQYTDPEALGKFLANKYRQEYDSRQRSEARAAAGGVRAPAPKTPKQPVGSAF